MGIRLSQFTRTRAAILALAGLCLLSSAKSALNAGTTRLAGVQQLSHELRALRPLLPQHGVIGYLDDRNTPEALQAYYLTQYELAPRVVKHSPDAPVVIGNFSGALPGWPTDLVLVHDFGNGLVLFAKSSRILASRGR